jgi:hypothetical protein
MRPFGPVLFMATWLDRELAHTRKSTERKGVEPIADAFLRSAPLENQYRDDLPFAHKQRRSGLPVMLAA